MNQKIHPKDVLNRCSIFLKPNEELRIQKGHTWVYGNEVDRFEGHIQSGELAYVYSFKGIFIGKGYLNTSSKIVVRILSRNESQVIDESFFSEIIRKSNQTRIDLGYKNSYRMLFGEADGIPGLIIDKYGEYLVLQILSLGIDMRKAMFVQLLIDLFHPKGILERSDVPVRKKEGLEPFKNILYGQIPNEIEILENNLKMKINLIDGQKTGSFLDQQSNHEAIKTYVKGQTVLDCFSHIGGFGLTAAYYGAKHVTCLDISQAAVDQILENSKLNQLKNIDAEKADVFKALRTYQDEGKMFDVIVLDPPAFAKKKDDVKKAYHGYKEINLQAMKIINDEGYLYTCSCSHFMPQDLFLEMLTDAANDAQKTTQLIELRMQGKDHPITLGSDESFYLKCAILKVKNQI